MMYWLFTVIIAMLALTPQATFSQTISDYLILQDIGSYILDRPEKKFPGMRPTGGPEMFDHPGIVGVAGHFSADHTDKTYKVMYIGGNGIPSPTVLVSNHAGSDSDKCLLHEVDREFRNYYGLPGNSFGPRQINGQTIIENLVAGGSYRWVSGTKVIVIEYHDGQMTKPEPLEVIQAYLAMHPSTMPTFTLEDLRSATYKTKWIKDEMDRRLWICDKWFMQLQLKKVKEKQVYDESVKNMKVFLDYREKYYGLKAADEKNLLAEYHYSNNGTGIKTKLTEYRNWWTVNKNKTINL